MLQGISYCLGCWSAEVNLQGVTGGGGWLCNEDQQKLTLSSPLRLGVSSSESTGSLAQLWGGLCIYTEIGK